MNEEAGFIAALLAEPADRTTLLVYADWLDERADPRAEFLRLIAADEWDWDRIHELRPLFDPIWVCAVRDRCGVGCAAELTGGPFAGEVGEVIGLYPNGDKLLATVRVTSWGQPIDVEVDYWLIQRTAPSED